MTISFECCVGFSCIRISDLPNLLSLEIIYCEVEEIHIVDTPKLLSFEYSSTVEILLRPSLDIGTCQNLRSVEFRMVTFDDTVIFNLIRKLPFIKELILRFCDYLKNLKISSSTPSSFVA